MTDPRKDYLRAQPVVQEIEADAVREFAEWYRVNWSDFNWIEGPPIAAGHYLAAKEGGD